MAETVDLEVEAREHAVWLRQVMAANNDLAERLDALGITVDYDDEDDALYLNIGPPTEALTTPVADEVYYRVEPDTLKIVGVECWSFRAAPTLGLFHTLLLYLLHAARRDHTAQWTEATAEVHARLAADIRELVAA